MTRTERAALSVLAGLLASTLGGAALVLLTPPDEEEALLIATIFLTTVLAAVSAFASYRIARARHARNAGSQSQYRPEDHGFLSPRQVMILTLGLTAIAALTGTGTGARIITDGADKAAAVAPSPAASPSVPLLATPTPATTRPTETVTASPTDSDSPSNTGSPTPTDSASSTPAPGATTYLDSTSPVNGGFDVGAVSMSGTRYPRSITMWCQRARNEIIEWNVAGYHTFSATVGVGDDTSNAFGGIMEVIFYDQDGHLLGPTINASLGHPVPVTLKLDGVVHLRVACSGRDAKNGSERGFYGAFGDPVIVHS